MQEWNERELESALERDEFFMLYQPVVCARSREVVAAEALIRWKHDGKVIPPNVFIPLLEETGLIVPVGEWILQESCSQMKSWLDNGCYMEKVSVNFSARQFERCDVAAVVERVLNSVQLDPAYLTIELTEGFQLKRSNEIVNNIRRLRQLGVSVAVDDFGAGYSMFNFAHFYPVDCLKIDRSLVQNITGRNAVEFARAVIRLSHELDVRVVAEGIETEEQLKLLAGLDCDRFQGFYFSKPVESSLVAEMLHSPVPV